MPPICMIFSSWKQGKNFNENSFTLYLYAFFILANNWKHNINENSFSVICMFFCPGKTVNTILTKIGLRYLYAFFVLVKL